jgi:hypothetical protein
MIESIIIRWCKPLIDPAPGNKLLTVCFAHQCHPVQDRFFCSPYAQRDLLSRVAFCPQIQYQTFIL